MMEQEDIGRVPAAPGSRASTEPPSTGSLGPSGFDPSRYGFAAYCAGWKAAMLCFRDPTALKDGHARKWIESNPPETFDMPMVWRELASDSDGSPKGGDAARGSVACDDSAGRSEAEVSPQ